MRKSGILYSGNVSTKLRENGDEKRKTAGFGGYRNLGSEPTG
jgi:hypothetical protein